MFECADGSLERVFQSRPASQVEPPWRGFAMAVQVRSSWHRLALPTDPVVASQDGVLRAVDRKEGASIERPDVVQEWPNWYGGGGIGGKFG